MKIHLCTSVFSVHFKGTLKSGSPILSSPNVIAHPPTPYVIQAWWTSSTGFEAISPRPPGVGDRRWLVGCVPVASCTGRFPLTVRSVHPFLPFSPTRRPFLPGPLSTRHPTSHSPAMARTGRKAFIGSLILTKLREPKTRSINPHKSKYNDN